MTKLSIIIPVYNEKNTIEAVIRQAEDAQIGGVEKEIIVIDDGSTDGSREILARYENKHKIILKGKNEGKGSAVKIGFNEAEGDFLIIQDADMEYSPSEYFSIIEPLAEGRADVVFSSRFLGSKPHRVQYFYHYLGNRFLTFLSNIFSNLNLSDMESGYKAFNRRAINLIKNRISAKRFGIEPELVALSSKNKLRIYEVGVSYRGRSYSQGKKINWKDGLAAVWHIVRYNIFSPPDKENP